MGRIFLRELEDPDADHYFCKFCNTPIALAQDCYQMCIHTEKGKAWIVEKAINFQVEVLSRQVGANKLSDINCVTCGQILGFTYVEIGALEFLIHKDNVALYMRKLLKKQGNDIVSPHSPVTDEIENEEGDWEEAAPPPDGITIPPLNENPENGGWNWEASGIVTQPPSDDERWEAADPPPASEITIQPPPQNPEIDGWEAADPPPASEITIQPQPENPENAAAAAAPPSEITIQSLLQNLEIANALTHDQNQELEAAADPDHDDDDED